MIMGSSSRIAGDMPRLSHGDFSRLSRFIYEECGIKMPPTKKSMLEARLGKRLRELNFRSFAEYCGHLFSRTGAEERVKMIDLATTNKTDFFREADHFDILSQRLLPEWRLNCSRSGARRLMVWSAGCSTGEEPYTLAMMLHEFKAGYDDFDYQILAYDISTKVLEKAALAIYREERIAPVPQHLQRKYLLRSRERESGLYRVIPELRAKVRFRRINFMESNFGVVEKMDIIFCRNVIIYFDRPTQEKLLKRFCSHIATGGLLFMGHSETLSGFDLPLVQICPTVYRKVP